MHGNACKWQVLAGGAAQVDLPWAFADASQRRLGDVLAGARFPAAKPRGRLLGLGRSVSWLLGLLYVGVVLLKPAPLPSLEEVIKQEETRQEVSWSYYEARAVLRLKESVNWLIWPAGGAFWIHSCLI